MSLFNVKRVAGVIAIAVASASVPASAAIVNGSFEGSTAGWTLNGPHVGYHPFDHTGNGGGSAYLYQYADGVSQLDQSVTVNAATQYTLNWWSLPNFDAGANENIFQQVFVFDADFNTLVNEGYASGTRTSPAWSEHMLSFNTGVTTQITIRFQGADGGWDNVYLDDISLSAVPEPTALGFLAIGGVALLRRRGAE